METIKDENQNVNGLAKKARRDRCINLNFVSNEDRLIYEEAKEAFKDYSVIQDQNGKCLVFRWKIEDGIKSPQFIQISSMMEMGLEWNFFVDASDNPKRPKEKAVNFIKDVWLKSHTLPIRWKNATFNPDPNFQKANQDILNLWTGYVEPKKGQVEPFYELLDSLLIGTKEHKEHLIKLIAYSFKYPHVQHGTSIGLFGEQGAGKSTIGKTIAAMCPNHSSTVNNVNDLSGFAEHLMTTKFFLMEESQFSGDKGIANLLKDLITNDRRTIKIKFLPAMTFKNVAFFLFTSNSTKCVPVGMSERRYNIFECSNKLSGNFEYFEKYDKWLKNGGANALLYHLLNEVDLEGFNPRQIVKTEGRAKAQQSQFEPFEDFVFGLLKGDIEIEHISERWNSFEITVQRTKLYELFKEYYGDISRYVTATAFSRNLNEMFMFDEVNPKWCDSWKLPNQPRHYLLPPKHKCQEIFAAKAGQSVKNLFPDYSVPELKPETVEMEQLKAAEFETQKVLQGIKDKQTELQPFAEIEN